MIKLVDIPEMDYHADKDQGEVRMSTFIFIVGYFCQGEEAYVFHHLNLLTIKAIEKATHKARQEGLKA